MQQMLTELSQPENLNMMMSMVGNLLGGRGSQNIGSTTSPQQNSNQFGNLLNQLLGGGQNVEMEVDSDYSPNYKEYFDKILNDSQAKKITFVKDIPLSAIKLDPNPDFKDFVLNIVNHFTIQEIIDLRSVNLRGIIRLRRQLREQIKSSLSRYFSGDVKALENNLISLISENLLINESDQNIFINQNFDIEIHLNKFIPKLIGILIDETINDIHYESSLLQSFLTFVEHLYDDLKSSYINGKDGALFYLVNNNINLIKSLIGEEAIKIVLSYNEDCVHQFVNNVVELQKKSEKNYKENGINQNNPIVQEIDFVKISIK